MTQVQYSSMRTSITARSQTARSWERSPGLHGWPPSLQASLPSCFNQGERPLTMVCSRHRGNVPPYHSVD